MSACAFLPSAAKAGGSEEMDEVEPPSADLSRKVANFRFCVKCKVAKERSRFYGRGGVARDHQMRLLSAEEKERLMVELRAARISELSSACPCRQIPVSGATDTP